MRVLFTALMTSVFLVVQYLDNPALFVTSAHVSKDWWHKTFQEKEVRLEGLKWLSRTEIERVLPLERSVLWWMFNAPAVQSKVAESPWVGGASVERCGESVLSEWGCFVVSVKERAPRFLAVVDDEAWVISDDGTFVLPAASAMKENSEERYRGLVTIEGLASRHQSPDLVRSQVALASTTIATLEKAVKLKVKGVDFVGRGDIAVSFQEQGERCAKLLGQLNGRLTEVDRIDLAFSQVGVVKFKGQQP
jgi:cell division septal protein FtsQ